MEDRYLCRAKRTDNGEWVKGYLIKDIPNPDKAYIFDNPELLEGGAE